MNRFYFYLFYKMAIKRDVEKFLENLYIKNKDKGKAHVAKLFIEIGYSRATAYRKIQKLEQGSLKRAAGSGRRTSISTPANVQKVFDLFNNKSGISQRNIAKLFNCSAATINNILKRKTEIKNRKKK